MEENNVTLNNTPQNEPALQPVTPPAQPVNPYAPGTAAPLPPAKAAPKREKPRFEVTKEDLIFSGIAAAAALFGVIAGLWGGFRLGYTAAFLLNFAVISVYLARAKHNPGPFGALCGLLAAALAPVFTLTSNEVVRLFTAPGEAILSVIWFASLAGRKIPAGDLGLAAAAVSPLLDATGGLGKTLGGIFSGSNRMKRASKILLGVLCAVPVLCCVVPLLSASDFAFEGMLQTLFADLGTRVAQILIAAAMIPLIVSFAFSLKKEEKEICAPKEGRGLDTAFIAAFLGALGVAYVFYLGSQLAYFFDAFKGILPEGYRFSYAEYARRGFFELCAVAAINLALLSAAMLFSRKKEGRLPAAIKAVGTFISLFTLVLIGTALAKMALYIQNYGMTVLRLGVGVFTAFLAVVFLAALMRLFTARVKVLPVAAVTAALALIVLGLGNINGFVAKYNYDAYVTHKLEQIDVKYLASLGPEAAPYLVKLAENEKEDAKVRRSAALGIYDLGLDLYDNSFSLEDYTPSWDEYSSWDAAFELMYYEYTEPLAHSVTGFANFSLPQKTAYEALDAFFAAHPDFCGREFKKHNDSRGEFGYFDADETTTAPPAAAEPETDKP